MKMKTKLSCIISVLVTAALVFSVAGTASTMIPVNDSAARAGEHLVLTFYAKPGTVCGNGICEPSEKKSCPQDCQSGNGESTCYAFIGKGVKWKDLPIDIVIDPDNPDDLTEDFITSAISAGAEEWDTHTSAELFGSYSIVYDATWDGDPGDTPDGRNEMLFGDYPTSGVIAVAAIWGNFIGPPSSRGITEFDILFDTDYTWGDATVNPAVMDLQNIATHELGHGVGLDDLYDSACSAETMYGYSDYGETSKRTLEDGDIAGIRELYGA